MKKKIKKAFTLVELLVVIAILAILATVSIVGYNSFTKKARVSNDTALVSQLNTLLKADEILNESVKCPTDALKVTEAAGYDVEKLTPTTNDYEIIWNQETNQFVLLDENKDVVFGEKNTDEYKNWRFVDSYDKDSVNSMYLKGSFYSSNIEDLKVGIDVGNNTKIDTISYINDDILNDTIIRTNGGVLTINDSNDTILHFGNANTVNVNSIGKEYHEYGSARQIVVKSGKVVNESSAVVVSIAAQPDENKNVTIDVSKKVCEVVVEEKYSQATTVIGTSPVSKSATIIDALNEAKKYPSDATRVPEGFVIDKTNYQITLKDEVALLYYGYVLNAQNALSADTDKTTGQDFTSFWYSNGVYGGHSVKVLLDADIDLNNAILEKGMSSFGGLFDGQNHTIKNVKITDFTSKEIGLFSHIGYFTNVRNITLDNIIVTTNCIESESRENVAAGILAGSSSSNTSNITINNCQVVGGKYTGAVIGYAYGSIENCKITNTTVSGQYKTGGIVGYICSEVKTGVRKVNDNKLNNVIIKIENIMQGKSEVIGRIVGNFNGDDTSSQGECLRNKYDNLTTTAAKNIGHIESAVTVSEN